MRQNFEEKFVSIIKILLENLINKNQFKIEAKNRNIQTSAQIVP
jgi:hypothetical protein